jgi:hypothetical protein
VGVVGFFVWEFHGIGKFKNIKKSIKQFKNSKKITKLFKLIIISRNSHTQEAKN